MTALKAVTTLDQIPKCEADVSKDSKYLAIKKDDSDKWVPEFVGLDDKKKVLNLLSDSSDTPAASLPDVNGFIDDKLLNDWMSICRDEIPRKKGRALQLFVVSKTPLAPKGVFDSCDKQSSAMRKFMDMPLSPEAAKYLKSKFAQDPGCSSIMEDGTIYYKLLADESQIKIAIASIEKDIKAKKFPKDVNEKMAQGLIGQLEAIAAQDPVVVQKEAMRKQFEEMRSNMSRQLWFTGLLQGGSTAVFATFFYKQMKLAKKTLERLESEKKGNGSALERYGRNLNEEARRGRLEPVNAQLRSAEIKNARGALMNGRSVVLTGEAGVGKTAVAEALAFEINAGNMPELGAYDIVMLDLNKMVGGTKYRGEFEDRLQSVLEEVLERNSEDSATKPSEGQTGPSSRSWLRRAIDKLNPYKWGRKEPSSAAKSGPLRKVILFMDELHRIMGWGGAEGAEDASQILKPPLARGELTIIGATTKEEFKHIEKDRALKQRFKEVFLRAFNPDETFDALKKKLPKIGKAFRTFPEMQIPDDVLRAVTEEAGKRFPDDAFPRKADNLLKDLVGWKRLEAADGGDVSRASSLTIGDAEKFFAENPVVKSVEGTAPDERMNKQQIENIRRIQLENLRQWIVSMEEFRSYPPERVTQLAELAYQRESEMTMEERIAHARDPEMQKAKLVEWAREIDSRADKKGGNGRGNGEGPPPAPAGGNGSPPPAPATGDSSTASARSSLITPYATVTPSPAIVDAASRMPIGAMIPDVGAALDRIPQIVLMRAVTPEGVVFNVVAVEPPPVQQVASPGVRGSVTLPPGAVDIGGSALFPGATALSVASGAGGLVASEVGAALLRRPLGPWEEFVAFVGTGMGISGTHAAMSGAAVTMTGMGAALLHGLPSCLITFGATGKYFAEAGLELGGRAHKYATILGGSVLVAAATTAEIGGGATVAEMGLSGAGFAMGIGASIGVGAALLAGGAVGHFGNRWAAEKIGIVNSDGDTSISGWWADEAANMTPRSAQLMIHDIAAWF